MFAVLGFKGAGKDTLADNFVEHGYTKVSFSSSLKDVLSVMFSWDRALLEGDTEYSRQWRETVDPFWEKELGIPQFTPRFALTHVGSDVLRKHFHNDIWLISTKKRINEIGDKVIVTDCRFKHEIALLESLGAHFIRVDKGNKPEFWDITYDPPNSLASIMSVKYPSVHQSEWEWNSKIPDYIATNDGTKQDLAKQAHKIYEQVMNGKQ